MLRQDDDDDDGDDDDEMSCVQATLLQDQVDLHDKKMSTQTRSIHGDKIVQSSILHHVSSIARARLR